MSFTNLRSAGVSGARTGALALALLGLQPVLAQSSGEAEAGAELQESTVPGRVRAKALEEVLVTAQKREESLSDIPLAISAFGGEAMDKQSSTSLEDSMPLIPNMQAGNGGMSIRGIGTTAITLGTPTVATHVDGIYTGLDPRGLLSNFDIARVEVMRGPQGTLYGRNATAGVVNLITGKPGPEFEISGDIAYRTPSHGYSQQARLVLNVPIIEDSLAVRFAGLDTQSEGFLKNPAPGEDNADAPEYTLLRFALGWQPFEALHWDINYEHRRDTGIAGMFQTDYYVSKPDRETAIVYPTGFEPDEVPPFGPGIEMFGPLQERQRNDTKTEIWRSTLAWDITEAMTLSWIAGREDLLNRSNGMPFPIILFGKTLKGHDLKGTSLTDSHELNLNFDAGWGHGVFGLYHYKRETADTSVLWAWLPTGSEGPENPPELSQAGSLIFDSLTPNVEISRAAFGQITFNLSETLRLTGGLRYGEDISDLGSTYVAICPPGEFENGATRPGPVCTLAGQVLALDAQNLTGLGGLGIGEGEAPPGKKKWSNVSYKVTVDGDIGESWMGYATVSTGYKQGLITVRSAETVDSVKPETNINYEVGIKGSFLDDSANINMTVFWMDYTDLQVNSTELIDGAPTLTLDNAGKALSRGVELEYSWQISPLDRIDGYVTYLDATFTEWDNAPDTLRGQAFTFDAKGNTLANAPKYSFRLGYSHIFDLGHWGEIVPSLATYYSDKLYINHTNDPWDEVEAYWRSDFNLNYTAPDERLNFNVFVNNIEDKRVRSINIAFTVDASDTGPGGGMQFVGHSSGRIVGARMGFKF